MGCCTASETECPSPRRPQRRAVLLVAVHREGRARGARRGCCGAGQGGGGAGRGGDPAQLHRQRRRGPGRVARQGVGRRGREEGLVSCRGGAAGTNLSADLLPMPQSYAHMCACTHVHHPSPPSPPHTRTTPPLPVQGFDLELVGAVSDAVTIPVIASSGAGAPEHFSQVRAARLLWLLPADLVHAALQLRRT